jgi:hypothetical protein
MAKLVGFLNSKVEHNMESRTTFPVHFEPEALRELNSLVEFHGYENVETAIKKSLSLMKFVTDEMRKGNFSAVINSSEDVVKIIRKI